LRAAIASARSASITVISIVSLWNCRSPSSALAISGILLGDPAFHLLEQRIGGIAVSLAFLRRQIGRVANLPLAFRVVTIAGASIATGFRFRGGRL
jgi:hypothetical protein